MVLAKLSGSTVEINDLDDLLRVVKEARGRDEPLVIRDNGTEFVVPPSHRSKRRRVTPEERAMADEEAFLSSAGSLAGLFDPDEFRQQYRAARGSRRTPVVLDFSEE
jgi:hypothetical protein